MRQHTISFLNAFRGIWTAIITQSNLRIHFIAASLVIFASLYLKVATSEIIVLILTIGLVMIAEMVNTSLEFMSDAITLEHNEKIKHAKDVAAGAVLLSAIFAVLVGLMVFLPKLV
jgi:diacylglycerol kinase